MDLFLWEAGRWTFSNPFQTCFPCISVPLPSPVPPGALVAWRKLWFVGFSCVLSDLLNADG